MIHIHTYNTLQHKHTPITTSCKSMYVLLLRAIGVVCVCWYFKMIIFIIIEINKYLYYYYLKNVFFGKQLKLKKPKQSKKKN